CAARSSYSLAGRSFCDGSSRTSLPARRSSSPPSANRLQPTAPSSPPAKAPPHTPITAWSSICAAPSASSTPPRPPSIAQPIAVMRMASQRLTSPGVPAGGSALTLAGRLLRVQRDRDGQVQRGLDDPALLGEVG